MIPPHQSMPSTRPLPYFWFSCVCAIFRFIQNPRSSLQMFLISAFLVEIVVVMPAPWKCRPCTLSEVFKSEAPRSEVKCSSASLFWKGHADTAEESAYIHPHLEVMEQLSMPHDPPTSNTSARWSAPHLMGVHEDCDVTPVNVVCGWLISGLPL